MPLYWTGSILAVSVMPKVTVTPSAWRLTLPGSTTPPSLNVRPVQYKGILPDLFAEGQGVVAQGKLDEQGVFCASEVLAKHDENYMPPEAAKALEDAHKAGVAKKQAEQAQAAKS